MNTLVISNGITMWMVKRIDCKVDGKVDHKGDGKGDSKGKGEGVSDKTLTVI